MKIAIIIVAVILTLVLGVDYVGSLALDWATGLFDTVSEVVSDFTKEVSK